jgi:pyruvate/2-oxoglutarate dehydrogenase complex dihydrolipoamide acyltransferase (E2) component
MLWLWHERSGGLQSIGEVASPKVNITSPAAGVVLAIPNEANGNWSVFDRVDAGDVIAKIELQTAEATETIDVVAPVSGTIVDMTCWPGQAVIPGQIIATIVADRAEHVLSYVPEDSRLEIRPGMKVTLHGRSAGAPRIDTEVQQVGKQILQVPRHQRSSVTMPQWGAPVRIKIPNDASLQPGMLVDVLFHKPPIE